MSSHSEAVIVGTELLLGLGIDTNGADIGRQLAQVGCPLRFKTVVGDSDDDLDAVLSRAVQRSDVVVISGGLGPTEDDRTRFAVARVAGVELELRPELMDDIRAAFQRFNREMGESNLVQARLPRGAEAIRNSLGTAPGFALEVGRAFVVALPGVPRELRHLLESWAAPRIAERLGAGAVVTRVLRLSGVGESRAGEAIADLMTPGNNPYVGMLASPGEVRVFITARAATAEAAARLIEAPEAEVRGRLAKYFFGVDEETHALVALREATRAGWTLATIEGFTGGALASRLWESHHGAYLGGQVWPPAALARKTAGAADGEEAILSLARAAGEAAGASAGLAVALEAELLPAGNDKRVWIGVWAGPRTAIRSVPIVFGGDTDRLRSVHQALYELRTLAATGASQ